MKFWVPIVLVLDFYGNSSDMLQLGIILSVNFEIFLTFNIFCHGEKIVYLLALRFKINNDGL